jgi:hypothetical protein
MDSCNICREGTNGKHTTSVWIVISRVRFEMYVSCMQVNRLEPSDPYMGRTAQLTSRSCILNTYSTNTRTEYFKRAA